MMDELIILAYGFALLMMASWIAHAWWHYQQSKKRLQHLQHHQETMGGKDAPR